MQARLLAILLLPVSLFSATLRVNNAPGTSPDYATIQAAINAAADGDTILIEGSTTIYTSFSIINKRLSLIGPGYGLAVNPGTPVNKLSASITGPTSFVRTQSGGGGSADGSLVMGLEFLYDLVLEGCANVTVSRCNFNASTGSGRLIVNGPNNVISQCIFRGPALPSNAFGSASSGLRVENCIMGDAPLFIPSNVAAITLKNNLLQSLNISSPATFTADNNLFINSGGNTSSNGIYRNNIFPSSVPPGLVGSGNLSYPSINTVVVNSGTSFDARYQLAASPVGGPANPALNAGTDGTHIGPFGGANPYILSGVPPLPTIDELSVPQFVAPGGNLNIRIKVGERP